MNVAPLIAVLNARESPRSARLDRFCSLLTTELGLHPLHDDSPMQIFGQSAAPHLLLPSSGLIWGRIFDKHTNRPVSRPEELRGAHASAEGFAEHNWGNYLAFRTINGVPELLRDPSGGVPCYHALVDGAHIFVTRPELFFDLGILIAEIDWTVLAQAIAYRDWKPARTAVRGVSELLPGMAARLVSDQIETNVIWSPWKFVEQAREISDSSKAVEVVRRAGANCMSAWRGTFDRPLVEVSGGLDSSIIAALMRDDSHQPMCVTFAAAEGDPDETPYARAVADHLGSELHVLRANVEHVDLTQSAARDVPRPCARGFTQGMDRQLRELAVERGADSFFSGGGGDNVFCYLQSALPLLDRVKRTGLNGGTLATIDDLAELAQVSIFEVITRAIRSRVRSGSGLRWKPTDLLSASAARELPRPFGHPWTEAPANTPPGKRAHVRALVGVQNHLEGHDRVRFAPIISPLLSQPLVEACLQIPTWLWCEGGLNRAVARKAFADRLPKSVVERRSKGAFDGFCAQLVHRNRRLLREMLLDGVLVRRALVDAASIEGALAAADGQAVSKLLVLADVEAWVTSWSGRRAKSA